MKKSATSGKSRTDWKRVDALKDNKIDFSDTPELTPEVFARAVVRRGLKPVPPKKQLTLRVDSDVLEWYRRQGPGYQTRINALLRAYMQEHLSQRA
ncbi:MAG TPA: BrnA antitoxin family protein [Terriglobia bacterium]|nr:BrnA antitoxin family protein [Terriglobia bacterium]